VVIGDALSVMARWSVRLLLIAAAAYLLSYVVSATWPVLLPVLLALLLSSALHPLVDWLVDHRVGRTLAAAMVVVGFLLLLVGTTVLLTQSVIDQVGEVADAATGGLESVRDWVTGPPLSCPPLRWTRRSTRSPTGSRTPRLRSPRECSPASARSAT
jgi:predicted PurR-regulated permease PerM